jgi:hypothetical protein
VNDIAANKYFNVREERVSKDVIWVCLFLIIFSIPFFLLTRNLVYLIASSVFALFVILLDWYLYRWIQPAWVIIHQDSIELEYLGNKKPRIVYWSDITKIWIAENPKKSVSGAGVHYSKQKRIAKKGFAFVLKPEIAQEVIKTYKEAMGTPPPS